MITKGSTAFVVAAALFVLYPVVRPYGDLTAAGSAEAFASPWWLVSHLAAMAGFALVGAGLLDLRDRTGAHRSAGLAVGLWGAGTAAVLPYYGAETFALHAIGSRQAPAAEVVALAEAVRTGAAQLVAFGAGLALLAAGAVAAAVVVARGRPDRSWLGIPFAVAFATYLPQFFLAPGLRIAHGLLVAVGCLLLAGVLRGAGARTAAADRGRIGGG